MRAFSLRLIAAAPVKLQPKLPAAASRAAPVVATGAMGQALSLLQGLRRGGSSGAASSSAAKAGRAAADRPAEEDPDLWMICGLGNPGPRYETTRHNVGFMALDALARQEAIAMDRLQEQAVVGRGRFCGKKLLLCKPAIFMNNSGEAVGRLARFYRVRARVGVCWCRGAGMGGCEGGGWAGLVGRQAGTQHSGMA